MSSKKSRKRPGGPLRRHTEQVQQVPDLDGMYLHRRRGQQDQPSGAVLQSLHQPEKPVRSAFLLASGTAPPGVVSFVEHHQIPRFGIFQKRRRPIPPAHQVARRNHRGFAVPVVAAHLAFVAPAPRGRRIPGQLAAIVDGPVEIELLAQLDLPLLENGLGRQDQDPFGAPGEPCLAQQHARLDGLAEADLVGDQKPGRPIAVEAVEGAHLVRPRRDRRGRFADPLAAIRQGRRVPDERPDAASQIACPGCGRRLGVRRFRRRLFRWRLRRLFPGPLLEAGGFVARRHEAHQIPPCSIGHIEDNHALRLVGPDAREVGLLVGDPPGFRPPARIDADALPVVPPAGGGLVEAAGPGDPVAAAIFDDAGLLVKDAVGRDRLAVRAAGNGDLHVEKAPRPPSRPAVPARRRMPGPAAPGAGSPDAVRRGREAARPSRWPRSRAAPGCSRRPASCARRCAPALRCRAPPGPGRGR